MPFRTRSWRWGLSPPAVRRQSRCHCTWIRFSLGWAIPVSKTRHSSSIRASSTSKPYPGLRAKPAR